MKTWNRIQSKLNAGSKVHVTVIDPAEQGPERAAQIARVASSLGTDWFLVGGSTGVTSKDLDDNVRAIKSECDLPVVFFGRSKALSMRCDAVLFMSILNSRNLDCVVGEHVKVTPFIYKLGLETISTAYVIVEPGMTVGEAAEANLVGRNDAMTALGYGLTAQLFGMDMFFLEAGSGATEPVPPAMVEAVKEFVTIPVLVSGGVDTPEKARALSAAGADILGTGTVAERRDFDRLGEIIRAFKGT